MYAIVHTWENRIESRALRSDDAAVAHDPRDVFDGFDGCGRITIDGHQVGQQAGRDAADLAAQVE